MPLKTILAKSEVIYEWWNFVWRPTVPLFLLALLEDENGINTAGGIGHITAVLDGDVSNPFVLNDYYQTN
jgi:hypothetical protein